MIYLVGKLPSWETYVQEHDGNEPGASSGNDGITFEFSRPELGRRVGPAVRSALRRLHVNTGHTPAKDLARLVRLAGGSEDAVLGCTALRCSACERMQKPQLARPSRFKPEDLQFNEVVFGDLFELPDSRGTSYWFLLMIDDATSYSTIGLVAAHVDEELWRAYEVGWLAWAADNE